MSLFRSLRSKFWIIALVLPWLAGCSAVRLSYNQGSTLAWWWLDSRVDFSAEQKPLVKAALNEWFAWHRATQLPGLADWLAGVREQSADKVTPAQVCAVADGLQQRMLGWYLQVLPSAAPIVRQLSAVQIDVLAKHYTTTDAELEREHLQADLAERRSQQIKRSVERFETLYGKLDSAQRQQVAAALDGSAFDADRWLAERRQRQTDIVTALRRLLAERADTATVQATLLALGEQAITSPRPAYRVYSEQLTLSNCAFAARMHNAMGVAQRRHLSDTLKGWESDARALAAVAVATGPAVR